ncbi:MAG: amidohydrolase [Gammaproteobacteria bacterium]|nr:amidohydrolase [Gammaproteobacteria bacterium]MDH5650933.1 amidohydrolase [Gammaproteobacteria bacterium]
MERRTVLKLLALGGVTSGLAGVGISYWPNEGVWNPCVADAIPSRLLEHDLVRAAWEGVDPSLYIDCHTHLVGTGDSDSGIWLNPLMQDPLELTQYVRLQFYLNASCIREEEEGVDRQYVEQLLSMNKTFSKGAKFMLLAFDMRHDQNGQPERQRSAFAIPDKYAAAVVQRYPQRFEWAASIHPYREDCVEALEWAVVHGAKAVKWLPPVMNIDPASSACDRFYAALVKHNIPLLTHAGDEHAVAGVDSQSFGNPQLLRRALDHGVKVIVAHCATKGTNPDIDHPNKGEVENYRLFTRMLDEPRYEKLLYGDVSAILQLNRVGPHIEELLQREEWHSRLLNGSDYPLPGVMPMFSAKSIADMGLLDKRHVAVLVELRKYNPMLYDFVLKRSLRSKGKRFAAGIFETRRVLQ